MTALWHRDALISALGGTVIGDLPESFCDVSIDSRTLGQGDIFFAIKGERFDGHDFVAQAYDNGAGAAVVQRCHVAGLSPIGVPLIVVDNVLEALVKLGAAARQRSRAKIVAITGSVGKTTTKEAMRQSFALLGKVHASPASFNNHWGVPLTLARMPEDSRFGIFEIGMNHANEIRPLVKLVKPHLAIITRVAAVHLSHFTHLEDIADAKAEIFEGVVDGGTVLLNADDQFYDRLKNKARDCHIDDIRAFGEAANADYQLLQTHLMLQCSSLQMLIRGTHAMVKIGAPGRHIIQNCLAVIAAADILNGDVAKVALELAQFRSQDGRGARYQLTLPQGGSCTLIDESYNANPTSMRAALEVLSSVETASRGRRIAVLGDMLELGDFAKRLHVALLDAILAAGVELLFLIGPEMRHLALQSESSVQTVWRCDVDDILNLVTDEVRNNDVMMVKSSNGIGTSRVVAALLKRYKSLKM